MMSHIYGPVLSRRLGSSLGVDAIPLKTCSFDCVYCQLGPTPKTTIERKEYVLANDILIQLKGALKKNEKIDYITFSGSGEPTLNLKLGEMIREIKGITSIPVVVLTNGSLLSEKELRCELLQADVVMPSLDAVSQKVFERVNRPHPGLMIEGVIEGIRDFISEFKGKVWIEVMLVKGINDNFKEMEKVGDIINRIGPAKVQLNTVVRPPCEEFAKPLTYEELKAIRKVIGDRAEIITPFAEKVQGAYKKNVEDRIMMLLSRRPVTLQEMVASLGLHRSEAIKYLSTLEKEGKVKTKTQMGKQFYMA